jgi:class 3 adenylate cyclase
MLEGYLGATGWQGPSGPPLPTGPADLRIETGLGFDEHPGKYEQAWIDGASSDREKSFQLYKLRAFRPRIHKEAWDVVLGHQELWEKLLAKSPVDAFVLSLDIRKSTELMRLAVTHEAFADFITALSLGLGLIIVNSHGIYDKFTGDGALAYFPSFYSGDEAGYWALKAAGECHACFERQYREHRNSFKTVPAAAGLGIGIDAGAVSIVRILEAPTVVGEPVVGACRLGAADAGKTLVNQQAYDRLSHAFNQRCSFIEETLTVKDGSYVVHSVRLADQDWEPSPPAWKKCAGS